MTGQTFSARALCAAFALAFFAFAPSSARAQPKLPPHVAVERDIVYGAEEDAKLDIYMPKELADSGRVLPTVVWIHGGGWAGGSKAYVAQYAAALAAGGFVVAAIDYSLPPKEIYPTPVRQAFDAFAFLRREAKRFHIDPARFFVAGDSAGAQIAAQVGAATTTPAYARKLGVMPTIVPRDLKGALLYCGAFDLATMGFTGPITSTLDGPLVGYSGSTTFRADPKFATFSVARYVTRAFPKTFITAGNDDDFEMQSRAFATRLKKLGVKVDDMFFDEDFTPRTGHVYNFALDQKPARDSVARSVDFMKAALGWR